MKQARRGTDGRVFVRAAGVAVFREGLRRRARGRGLRVTRVDVDARRRLGAGRAEARRRLQRAARAVRRGRHDPGHPRISRDSLHPFRRAGLGAGDEQGAGQEGRQGGRHSGRRIARSSNRFDHPRQASDDSRPMWSSRSTRGRASASSSSRKTSRIRRRCIGSSDWKYGDTRHGRALRARARADLRRDGRCGARRLRDHPDRAFLLRLRFKIRAGRIKTRMPGKNFTKYLPKNTDTGAQGSSSNRLPGRFPFGLPLRRPPFGKWRVDLARSQHPAGHDADVAGARNRRTGGAFVSASC